MIYFATPSTKPVRDAMRAGLLGTIATPRQGNRLDGFPVLALDNGCGPGQNGTGTGYPGDGPFVDWLERMRPLAGRVVFAVAPDVVGDAAATLERSASFLAIIRELGYPAALAAQNGLEHMPVPWDSFSALFLGDSPECVPCGYVRPSSDRERTECPHCHRLLAEWKLGAGARHLTTEAKRRGKWRHMGRVNSGERLRRADAMGCDSADGNYVRFGPDINLPKLLGWLRAVNDQGVLWEAS